MNNCDELKSADFDAASFVLLTYAVSNVQVQTSPSPSDCVKEMGRWIGGNGFSIGLEGSVYEGRYSLHFHYDADDYMTHQMRGPKTEQDREKYEQSKSHL